MANPSIKNPARLDCWLPRATDSWLARQARLHGVSKPQVLRAVLAGVVAECSSETVTSWVASRDLVEVLTEAREEREQGVRHG